MLPLIVMNNLVKSIVSGNIVTDITDHFSQVCLIKMLVRHDSLLIIKIKIRDYRLSTQIVI